MVSVADYGPRGPWFETFTPWIVLVKPRKPWTYDWLGQTVTLLETTSLCVKSKGPSLQTWQHGQKLYYTLKNLCYRCSFHLPCQGELNEHPQLPSIKKKKSSVIIKYTPYLSFCITVNLTYTWLNLTYWHEEKNYSNVTSRFGCPCGLLVKTAYSLNQTLSNALSLKRKQSYYKGQYCLLKSFKIWLDGI